MNKELQEKLKIEEVNWSDCTKCKIGSYAFSHVFGEGACPARYVFVGEAPGVSEDLIGSPFVGRSGRLLREALNKCGYKRSEVYITNVVACRPCDKKDGPNRAPNQREVLNCSKRLNRIFGLVNPEIVVAVGSVSADHISEHFSRYRMRSIYHPSYILRSGGKKSKLYKKWIESLKFIRKLIEEEK